jgi:hypothetical protein
VGTPSPAAIAAASPGPASDLSAARRWTSIGAPCGPLWLLLRELFADFGNLLPAGMILSLGWLASRVAAKTVLLLVGSLKVLTLVIDASAVIMILRLRRPSCKSLDRPSGWCQNSL